jgi:glycosyltransferase involved in cell wall biosynthesis
MHLTGEKMYSGTQPLVSIVTPVYNNEEYLAECIESVLAQTYQNWDYTIVNNCSTDKSGEIANRYASKNPRIRVLNNQRFLRSVQNHNAALHQISPESKYCKIVFSDDWIFPNCIEEMVSVGEKHPSVAVVGAYGLQEHEVMCSGLPYPSTMVSGRDVCRRLFLDDLYVFGTSTSVLYRSDLVRSRDPFYDEGNFHADRDVCVQVLKTFDFGFVHQILTFTRGRPGSLSSMAIDMQMDLGCKLQTLVAHGPEFLNNQEFEVCRERLLREYYNFLAVSLMRARRDEKFWDFHKRKLSETVGFSRIRLGRAILARVCKAVLNPYETLEKMFERGNSSASAVATENVDKTRFTVHAN